MKYIVLIFTAAIFCSCGDKAFINHKLTYEKLGNCSDEITPVKMLSNIDGERYELISCINNNFDGKSYVVNRIGDSIMVTFPKDHAERASFKLTLDVDAKPVYHHIFLDGKEILVHQEQLLDAQ